MAEPVAQLLRLADPGAADLRPQRHRELHLVAVHDHALAQLVQVSGVALVQSCGIASRARA